jgi:hypothetical protein
VVNVKPFFLSDLPFELIAVVNRGLADGTGGNVLQGLVIVFGQRADEVESFSVAGVSELNLLPLVLNLPCNDLFPEVYLFLLQHHEVVVALELLRLGMDVGEVAGVTMLHYFKVSTDLGNLSVDLVVTVSHLGNLTQKLRLFS